MRVFVHLWLCVSASLRLSVFASLRLCLFVSVSPRVPMSLCLCVYVVCIDSAHEAPFTLGYSMADRYRTLH